MNNKQKHLEFIQGIIKRLSGHSFSLKKWCITIITAILVLGSKGKNIETIIVSIVPVVTFWVLDGFYLYKERLFRSLYEKVRVLKENEIDYDMDTDELKGAKNRWISSIFSRTLMLFYLTLILAMLIVFLFL